MESLVFAIIFFYHDLAAKVVADAGMRANIACWVGNVQTGWGKNGAEYLDKTIATLTHRPDNPLVSWSMGPHSPYMVTQKTFIKINELSEQFKIPIHVHLHETQAEIDDSLKKYGKRPLQWMNECNLLTPRMVATHLTQLIPEEIELIADKKLSVIHCPNRI